MTAPVDVPLWLLATLVALALPVVCAGVAIVVGVVLLVFENDEEYRQ